MLREEPTRVARRAMATRFEIALYGANHSLLRAAGEEALDEIERLEAQLSLYRDDSDISDLNRRAVREAVPVDPRLFALLQEAARLSAAMAGAFDITVAPLMRCWGFVGGGGAMPTEGEIREAMACVGMRRVLFDAENYTVRFDTDGVSLDLGAIGKGYAIDRAAELLRENGVTSALLHGGTSTVYGLGSEPEGQGWQVAIQNPQAEAGKEDRETLATVTLQDAALSVSAPHGKSFALEGRRYGHVLDPRTGCPTVGALLAAVVTESATESDALSTALLTLGRDGLPMLEAFRPGCRALVVSETDADQTGQIKIETRGIDLTLVED